MENIIDSIKKRISIRDYQKEDLSRAQLEEIETILIQEIETPFNTKPRFALVNIKAFAQKEKVKLGTYGFIKGAQYFIVGASDNSANATIDYGFALEKIVLDLTQLGYGTCWLGGSFSRSKYAGAIDIKSNEVIPAISPVGIEKPNVLRGKMIRTIAGSKKRKAFNELFELESTEESIQAIDANFKQALEMLRLAPSADNFQPWRVTISKEGYFHFSLKRNPILKRTIRAVDLQYIDMGIAMAHFHYTLGQLGISGSWEKIENTAQEYIVSWK